MSTINGGCTPCCAPTVCGILPSDKEIIPVPAIKSSGGCKEKVCVHFDQFATGVIEPNILFPGLTLSTNLDPNDFPLMIFDSAAPTATHEDLGSPNETCCPVAGPGIGAAGEKGKPGENCMELKKVLIISDMPPAPGAPVPKPDGGIITVEFVEDVQSCEVHFLNVDAVGCGFVKIYDFDNKLLACEPIGNLGANSFQIVEIVSPIVNGKPPKPVRKMTIELINDAAVAKIVYQLCPGDRLCVKRICEDFDDFDEGEIIIKIHGGSITTNAPIAHPAMIFNSTAPTAGDVDLGSPNDTCDVPGLGEGAGGEMGEPGENCVDLSHILIISDDANTAIPKADPAGGQFIFDMCVPILFKEMHFLNAATDGDTITLYDENDVPVELIDIPNVGVNGSAKIQSSFPYPVKKIVVEVSGKTAISKVLYCICKGACGAIETVFLLDNVMTPVEITCTELQGTYMLLIESVEADGAKSTFMASSAHNAQSGSLARLTNAPSLTDESINIQWNGNEKIKLYHDVTKTGGIGDLIAYKVKLLTL
jgi:hypothetical protein